MECHSLGLLRCFQGVLLFIKVPSALESQQRCSFFLKGGGGGGQGGFWGGVVAEKDSLVIGRKSNINIPLVLRLERCFVV